MLHTASVSLIPLERTALRDDLDCPGDIIPYDCSFSSNSETLHLTWQVIIPGQAPINITYDGSENLHQATRLNSFVSTSLTRFTSDEFISSTLHIMVDSSTNMIELQCSMDEDHNTSELVFINSSSKSHMTPWNSSQLVYPVILLDSYRAINL